MTHVRALTHCFLLIARRALLLQFNDALGPTGRHLSQKGNNFCYRMLKEHLSDDLKIGPRSLKPHRPAAHVAAYPDGTDNDAKLRKKSR